MSAPNSLFVRAAKAQPTERTPVWFMRQAGPIHAGVPRHPQTIFPDRYLQEAGDRCRRSPSTAAEILRVDAAIIFADLLLPLEVMGLPFHFSAGEGPKIEKPVRTPEDIAALRTDRAAELGYVAEAVALVSKHFATDCRSSDFAALPLRSPAT